MAKYIYQYSSWPQFTWDEQAIQVVLGKIRRLQGVVVGRMESTGFVFKGERLLSTLTLDVVKSSEIEGENLNLEQVRSSIANRLGIEYAGMVHPSRDVDGVVEMMLDASQNYSQILDNERLFSWHSALFPTGRSGMHKIDVAKYRTGEMQIVSGAMGKERVHFEAPSVESLEGNMNHFLTWYNEDSKIDPVLKSAIAHFWFIIIHPFDDGNGRIARALSDMLLSVSEESSQRYYSLSNQILIERKEYYSVLNKVQHNKEDITEWLVWYLNCLLRALQASELTLFKVLKKSRFWDLHRETDINSRQRIMLNKILDGFEGKLKSSKWAKITKCSADTALRDIKDLMDKGILTQEKSGGRSTNYELIDIE